VAVAKGGLGVSTIGDNIRRIRTAAGIGQSELARRARVPPSTISNLENGHARSSLYLPRIADALGVEMFELDDELAARPQLPPTVAEFVDVDFLERLAAASLNELGLADARSRALAAAWVKTARRPKEPAPDDAQVRLLAQSLVRLFP
jgi:transcriptional regulator with XRE-family HTH domain